MGVYGDNVKMLTLADAFGINDISVPHTDEIVLSDLRDPKLKFSGAELIRAIHDSWYLLKEENALELLRQPVEKAGEQKTVAIVMPNSAEVPVLVLTLASHRIIVAPLNPKLTVDEFKFELEHMQASLLLTTKDGHPSAEEAAKSLDISISSYAFDLSTSSPQPKVNVRYQPTKYNPEKGILPSDLTEEIWPKEFDTALFFHTSGTTAKPKGVRLTHRNVTTSLMNTQSTLEFRGGPHDNGERDIGYLIMPLFHVHGLISACLAPLAVQSHVVIGANGFHKTKFWGDLATTKATYFSAVPTMFQIVLENDVMPSDPVVHLRFVRTSSAVMPAPTLEKAKSVFRCPVVQAYGMTEGSQQICSWRVDSAHQHPGTVGLPQGTEVAIVDSEKNSVKLCDEPGEIWIRGPNVIQGYYHADNPEVNTESFTLPDDVKTFGARRSAFMSAGIDLTIMSNYVDKMWTYNINRTEPYDNPILSPIPATMKWFHTGDWGVISADRYLQILGRIKFIINRGGEKITPGEINNQLMHCPEVADASVYPAPHPLYGEVVHACVVLRDEFKNDENAAREKIGDRLIQHLTSAKVPEKYVFVNELPKLASGKVDVGGLLAMETKK